jgi:DNA-binding MarR family transcriptional regulator
VTSEDEPRWLDEDERDVWLALVGVMIRVPAELDRQLQRDSDMSHFEYQVLAGLSDAPERTLRMSHLAQFTEGSLPRLSQVVGRLERRGWVARRPDPTDGRYTLATLTDDGFAELERAAPGHVEAVRRLVFDPLTPTQRTQLSGIGRAILDGLDRGGCDDDPTS